MTPHFELLGIKTSTRPPTHYELLGVAAAEPSAQVIEIAAKAQLDRLQPHIAGPLADDCVKIAAAILTAKETLQDPAARKNYDALILTETWWQTDSSPPSAPTVPVQNWWETEQVAEPKRPLISAAAVTETSVEAPKPAPTESVIPVPAATAPSPPAASVTPVAVEAAVEAPKSPVPANAPTVPVADWWKGEQLPETAAPAPTASTVAPAAPPTAPNPPVAPAWWKDEIKETPAPPPTTAAPGWWKDSVAEPVPAPVPSIEPARAAIIDEPSRVGSLWARPPAPEVKPWEEVPSRATPAAAVPTDREVVREEKPHRRKKNSRSTLPWIIVGLLTLGVAGAGVAWYVTQTDSDKDSAAKMAKGQGDADKKVAALPKNPSDLPKGQGDSQKSPAEHPKVEPPRKKTGDSPPIKVDPEPENKSGPKPDPTEFTAPAVFSGHRGTVLSIAVANDGKTFLTTGDDRDVLQHSIASKAHVRPYKLRSEGVAVALCARDKLAVFCDGGLIHVYDTDKQTIVNTFENPHGGIACIAPFKSGKFILSGATDGTVRVWNVERDKMEKELGIDGKEGLTALAISPDDSLFAAGTTDGRVCIWDLSNFQERKSGQGHKGRTTVLAFSPDGKKLFSGGEDGVGRVWALTGDEIAKLTGPKSVILGAAWSSDSRRIVTGGIDQQVHLWNAATGEMLQWSARTKGKIFSLALDPRERFVLAGQAEGIVELIPLPKSADTKE